MAGLVIKDKKVSYANFLEETVKAFVELIAAGGFDHPKEITRKHVYRRITMTKYRRYEDIYGRVKVGEYLYGKDVHD